MLIGILGQFRGARDTRLGSSTSHSTSFGFALRFWRPQGMLNNMHWQEKVLFSKGFSYSNL
jgi:hypothetical protein